MAIASEPGKMRFYICIRKVYPRAVSVAFSLLVFSFCLLFSSPFWLKRHCPVKLEYVSKEPFRLQTAVDNDGDVFYPGKLRIYDYEIPDSTGIASYTVRTFSPEKIFCAMHVSILSKGSSVRVKKFSIKGRGKTYIVDFRTLTPEQKVIPEGVKILNDGGVQIPANAEAVFRIVMPFHLRAGMSVDWCLFLYACLLSLIPALLVRRIRINSDFRRIPEHLFLLCCFIILLFPVSLIDYTGKVSSENRFFNEFPSIFVNSEFNLAFSKEFEGWLNDRFYGRKKLLRTNTDVFSMNWLPKFRSVSAGMLPENSGAMWGAEKWMFTKMFGTVDMALNRNRFQNEELTRCAENLTKLEAVFRKRFNAPMYIVLLPDKERVYYEFYPEHLKAQKEHEESRLEQLYRYLRENTDLKIIYPLPEMLKEKQKYRLYHKTGTHWTNRGAHCTANLLLKEFKKDFPWIDAEKGNVSEWKKGKNADIDIALMFGYTNPQKQLEADMLETDEPVMKVGMDPLFVRENILLGLLLGRRAVKPSEKGKGLRVLAVTDSFWPLMEPYLAPNVGDCLNFFFGFGRDFEITPYHNMIDEYKPDAVVIETAERFLYRFLTIRYGE